VPIVRKKGINKMKVIMFFIIILVGLMLIAVIFCYINIKQTETKENQKKSFENYNIDVSEKLQELVEETAEEEVQEEIVEKDIGVVKDTPTGYLNVREGPDTNYDLVTKVNPGSEYVILNEDDSWYEIEINEVFNWVVYGEYIEKVKIINIYV